MESTQNLIRTFETLKSFSQKESSDFQNSYYLFAATQKTREG